MPSRAPRHVAALVAAGVLVAGALGGCGGAAVSGDGPVPGLSPRPTRSSPADPAPSPADPAPSPGATASGSPTSAPDDSPPGPTPSPGDAGGAGDAGAGSGTGDGGTIGSITVTGTVGPGVEAGCLVLTDDARTYLLLGARDDLEVGARVTVEGRLDRGVVTTCQQGTPLRVAEVRPG